MQVLADRGSLCSVPFSLLCAFGTTAREHPLSGFFFAVVPTDRLAALTPPLRAAAFLVAVIATRPVFHGHLRGHGVIGEQQLRLA